MTGSFQDVLSAAIADLVEHGFDNIERINGWTRELRDAAARSLISAKSLEQELRDGLAAIYRKMVDNGQILKYHTAVDRFTLEKVRPALRNELDRRIMASANLIKLNRDEAVEKTLRRFQGWSTSIPPGGVSAEKKIDVKKNVRKALKALPYEERRVLTDQGHKLVGAISEIIASDGGAIAGRWRSHYRQAGYNYRPDHKERDDNIYLIRDSWAHRAGLVKRGKVGYYDEITAAGQEVNCFPDSTNVSAEGVELAYRRAYDGDICTIIFVNGPPLRTTPNHPILTARGWKSAGDLNEADHVAHIDEKAFQARKSYDQRRVPLISEIFASLRKLGTSERRSGKIEQFHGDGLPSDVDIVNAARPLGFGVFDSGRSKRRENFSFSVTDLLGSAVRMVDLFIKRHRRSASSFIRGLGQFSSPVLAFVGHPDEAGRTAISHGAASLPNDVADDLARHLEFFGQSEDAHAALMGATYYRRVLRIERSHFSGHVYNLQTASGWYIANGAIVHNCRCYVVWLYSLRDLPEDMLTAKGRTALMAARGTEEVRSARTARGDSAVRVTRIPANNLDAALLQAAVGADSLDFLRGLRRVEIVPDTDQWHGSTDRGVVILEAKFEALNDTDKLHTFMHEVGHLGQDLEPDLFREFERRHMGRMAWFVDMANPIHLRDFERRGVVDGGASAEVFAESYARFTLGLPMPQELAEFWRSRVTGLETQREALYTPWWPARTGRCQRCTMFVPGIDPRHNRCESVAGDIAIHGHCKLFEIKGARADSVEPDPLPAVGYEALRRQLGRLMEQADMGERVK